jgi:hypothetical protein
MACPLQEIRAGPKPGSTESHLENDSQIAAAGKAVSLTQWLLLVPSFRFLSHVASGMFALALRGTGALIRRSVFLSIGV